MYWCFIERFISLEWLCMPKYWVLHFSSWDSNQYPLPLTIETAPYYVMHFTLLVNLFSSELDSYQILSQLSVIAGQMPTTTTRGKYLTASDRFVASRTARGTVVIKSPTTFTLFLLISS